MLPYSRYGHEPDQEYWFQIWRDIDPIELARRLTAHSGHLEKLIRNQLPKGEAVLDGGCGLGQWSMHLASLGYEVTSIDFDEQTINRLREINPDIKWKVGHVQQLPFENNQFGGYILLGVIEHLQNDLIKAVKEAYRVLKESGILIVSVPFYSPFRRLLGLYQELSEDPPFYQYYFEQRELAALLTGSGFKVIASHKIDAVLGLLGELPYIGPLYVSVQKQLIPIPTKREVHNPSSNRKPQTLYTILKAIHDPINESQILCKIFAHMIVMVCKKI